MWGCICFAALAVYFRSWGEAGDTFDDYEHGGMTARAACCGCGGGDTTVIAPAALTTYTYPTTAYTLPAATTSQASDVASNPSNGNQPPNCRATCFNIENFVCAVKTKRQFRNACRASCNAPKLAVTLGPCKQITAPNDMCAHCENDTEPVCAMVRTT